MGPTLYSRHLIKACIPTCFRFGDLKYTHINLRFLSSESKSIQKCIRSSTPFGLQCNHSSAHHKNGHIGSLLYRNLSSSVKVSIESKPSLSLLLDEIYRLRDARATSLVVENKLKSLTFYYGYLQKEEKKDFLRELATKYSVKHDAIVKVAQQLTSLESNSGLMLKSEEKLRDLLTPQYAWLFTHLGRIENGVKFLVDLRCDILSLLSSTDAKSPHQLAIQQLNSTLKELLALWFSVGFLHLERVTWSSPCSLLQKISEYEAVHPVRSWTDIRQRVGPNRRCFVYTHGSMPGEPLVVLHVALTNKISDSMKEIIHNNQKTDDATKSQGNLLEEDPHNVKAFIFYSISSSQKGLQGVDLGNYLIKRAAKELHSEFPQARMFSSLSPIPTFRQWLLEKMKAAEKGENVFPQHEWEEILNSINPEDKTDAWAKLRSMLLDNSWVHVESFVKALKDPLLAACSRYLYIEKRRGYAFDSVANFHLRNGAVMWRLNWMADTSPRGLTNSCGLMINYRYYLDAADSNSLAYVQERKINASEQILNLSQGFIK